jgi:riboflavin synthase
MTLTEIHQDSYTFFAMQESFTKTNFGEKKTGDTFNIERCLQVQDRLDGHFVT